MLVAQINFITIYLYLSQVIPTIKIYSIHKFNILPYISRGRINNYLNCAFVSSTVIIRLYCGYCDGYTQSHGWKKRNHWTRVAFQSTSTYPWSPSPQCSDMLWRVRQLHTQMLRKSWMLQIKSNAYEYIMNYARGDINNTSRMWRIGDYKC